LAIEAFRKALEDASAEQPSQRDREECERLEVRGFPTFTIGRGEASARLNGWQPWEVFEDVLGRSIRTSKERSSSPRSGPSCSCWACRNTGQPEKSPRSWASPMMTPSCSSRNLREMAN